jgi:hypothetical protein
MRRMTMLGVAMIALAAVSASAQTPAHPDFSGHWVLVPDRPGEAPDPNAGAFAADCVIEVRGTTMAIDSKIKGATARRLFTLDGTETTVSGDISTSVSSAAWKGETLVLTTRSTLKDSKSASGTAETTRALSLAADGTLVIDVTTKSISGTQTSKSVYRKGE